MSNTRTLARSGVAALTLMTAHAALADVEIEYWQYQYDTRLDAMGQLIEQFEEANPDITVKMNSFPYADYRTKVAAAIPAGQGPDVVQLFYGWLNDYREAELIQPLPSDVFPAEKLDEEYFPMVQAMRVGGEYWALPTAVRSLALFYNTRLLEEAGLDGPPETLDELVDAAQAMTKRDSAGNVTQVGIAAGMNAQDHHWLREVLIRQMGGEPYLDDYHTVNYDTDAGRAAVEFFANLAGGENPVTVLGFMDEPQAAFKAGRAGMMVDGSFRIGSLSDTRGLEWGVTELPSHNGVQSNYSSYWVNAITTKAEGERYDAAVKFMQFITSDDAMQLWLEVVGELPAKPSVGMTEANAGDEVFGPFIRGLEYAHTTKFVDESGQRQVLMDMIERIDIADVSVADSVAEAAKAEQAILDEYYSR